MENSVDTNHYDNLKRFENIQLKDIQRYLDEIKPWLLLRQNLLRKSTNHHLPDVNEFLNKQIASCDKKIAQILDFPKEVIDLLSK
jgi:hypothetical protein